MPRPPRTEQINVKFEVKQLHTQMISSEKIRLDRAVQLASIDDQMDRIEDQMAEAKRKYRKLKRKLKESLEDLRVKRYQLKCAVLYNYEEVETMEGGQIVPNMVEVDRK